MEGLKNYKGDRDVTGNRYHLVSEGDLLVQELQNFINISTGDLCWDIRHGLDRKILLSRNVEAIKSEINNKIIEYYGDRVLDVYNQVVNIEKNKVSFKATISTVYSQEFEIGGNR